MIFSAIAMIVMGAMGTTTTLNANAFDLGLISKDTNVESVDTKSLFNCFGATITCDNDNTVNNNVSVNNGTKRTSQPNPPTCEECLADALTTQQIAESCRFFRPYRLPLP